MDRIFNNSTAGHGILSDFTVKSSGDPVYDSYVWEIKALINDCVDFEAEELAPFRELAQRYYYGKAPTLEAEEALEITGDPPTDENESNRSTVVSTDVRDTILGIMPSLMRIFAGTEHAVQFQPNSSKDVDLAKQATDYIRKKFWDEWGGFNILYSAMWDAGVNRVGIVTWGTDHEDHITVKTFDRVTRDNFVRIMSDEAHNPEALAYDPAVMDPEFGEPVINNFQVRFTESKPQQWVLNVAPEDFRISRNARNIQTANCVGYEEYKRVAEVVDEGYDFDTVAQASGVSYDFSVDRDIRNPGQDTYYPLNDLVKRGVFYIRVDGDGDGILELHRIVTIGEDYDILDDTIVDATPISLFVLDIRPHTAIGNAISELSMDIQRIKTNLIRGGLDSLAQSIFPRTVFNPLMTEAEDVMSDDIGAAIRTRANPAEAVYSFATAFVGKDAFDAATYLDALNQRRTGVSDASKGIDPKAFQSTNLSGIDAIITGAQERIELIARTVAECGVKQMYQGLLREIVQHPNPGEMQEIRGQWINVDASLYDADMRCVVNPMLGKGSDMTRLMALQGIAAAQWQVVEKFGLGNGIVGVQELRNTQVDIMALVNIKDDTRYFKQPTAQQIQAMESAPKDPDPQTLLAQSQMEEVKRKAAAGIGEQKQKAIKQDQDEDFRRDKLAVDAFVGLATVFKDLQIASLGEQRVLEEDRADQNHAS